MDSDQEEEWKDFCQRWDEHGLSSMMNAEQLPTWSSSIPNSSDLQAMQSSNPALEPGSHDSPSSTPYSTEPNSSFFQHLLGMDSPGPLVDPVLSTPSILNPMHTVDTHKPTSSRSSKPSEGSNLLHSSWLSTFLQSHSAAHCSTGLLAPSSAQKNLMHCGEGRRHGALAAADGSALQLHADLLDTGMGSLDEILEQMSNDFINYGSAGSLQEQLSKALSVSNADQLMMDGTSISCLSKASSIIDSKQRHMPAYTPTSSVSSDGVAEDESSSHEDTSQPLDQADEVMMQPPLMSRSNSATQLRSSDTSSPQADASAAPTLNDQDELKKRASKPARAGKKPKRERGTKLAIKIKSDVDVLDDGYKWRKYGQKPVKNSPYARNYYKCTDKQCNVKKHVERQAQEPEYVVATYEGAHNHSRPDKQLQALHSQMDATSHQHNLFHSFHPAPISHNVSTSTSNLHAYSSLWALSP